MEFNRVSWRLIGLAHRWRHPWGAKGTIDFSFRMGNMDMDEEDTQG